MKKNLILVILFLYLVFLTKSQEDDQQDISEDNNLEGNSFDYDDFDSDAYFKNSLKEYLVEKKLFESERAIPRDEMRKIFVDVVFDGEPQGGPEFMN